jgi:hypothetical protein
MSSIKSLSLACLAAMLFTQQAECRKNPMLCDTNIPQLHDMGVVKSADLKVQTADIFLVKLNTDGSVSTFIGKKNYAPFAWNLPGGKCTSASASPIDVAKRELSHDTGGHVSVNKWTLEKAPTLYSPKAHKAIFFIRDDRLTASTLNEGSHHAIGSFHKGFGHREMDEFKEVDLRDFMAKLQDYSKLVSAQQNEPKKLTIVAKDNTRFEFSASTALALADKYDLLRNLLTQITEKQF